MRSLARQAGACLVESRPSVQLVFLLRFLAGSLLGVAAGPARPGNVAVVAVGWTCCTMAIYLFNGVADREEDVANASTRPIASGRLPVRSAVAAVGALTVTGLLCVFSAGIGSGLLAVAYLLVGYAYSGPPFPLKRTYYTCTGAGVGLGLATYAAGFLAGGRRPDVSLVIFAGTMTLWMGCVGGIAKEFSDVEGDRVAGRRTWPMVLGNAGARWLLGVVAGGIATGLTVAALLYSVQLIWCAVTVLLGALGVTVAGLRVTPGKGRSSRRKPYRAFMATQLAAHLVLAASL
ncbi:UbiA family prenyltransferase [Streptomyces europaeiscabiei]|uniref:UbiA family prenyltransferase n=1 Tax=Streptomyces europaeiscabiei TaxID=146819 RepID=UPI002E17CD7B